MTPFDDFAYLINHVLLGDEPVSLTKILNYKFTVKQLNFTNVHFGFLLQQTIEDFILLVGTLVAFIAFILWCCFPIQPKVSGLVHFFKKQCGSVKQQLSNTLALSYNYFFIVQIFFRRMVLIIGNSLANPCKIHLSLHRCIAVIANWRIMNTQ